MNAVPQNTLAKRDSSAPVLITLHPVLAILGVLFGALTSIFTGALLSNGLADIQGAIGASSDDMSWVATCYNGAQMFIGPLTVMLGGLFGPRRILLWASCIFMLSEFLSPFVAGNIGALMVAQVVAGLAAGTYYPLTITVIVRNLPLKYLYFGIAVYALDILASLQTGTALEAFYMTHLSWQWIFWNALLIAPLLMIFITFGVPQQPMPKRDSRMNMWGFLFASVSLTLMYCALDQGERLDWFNSGTIVAFVVTGFILLIASLVRHRRLPHPMLNLSFLLTKDFLLLGAVLVCFRFLVLGPTVLIPRFLAVLHGYRPEQTGPILAWIAIPVFISAIGAGALLYKADSRLICAIGFILVGLTSLASSNLDPGWTGETFLLTQLFYGIGLSFALTGLVTSIFRKAFSLGALQHPLDILTISCWFQMCRLFGAEAGKAFMLHFLKVQGDLHYTILGQHINGNWLTDEQVKQLASFSFSAGSGIDDARTRAVIELSGALKQQIGLLSISDGFVLISLCTASCLVLLGFLSYSPPLLPTTKKNA
jgi:MFS transporter, DHA2 family, multidrug resistance protein